MREIGDLTPEQISNLNMHMRKSAEKRAGINPEKVQQTVLDYLRIAENNQLNYNELLQVFALTKESVFQSLSKLAISAVPDIISDDAKQ